VEQYNLVSSILHEIKQYNAEIDQDVLRIRQGLLKHYDTLDELSYKMTNSIIRLKEGESRISGIGTNIDQLVLKLNLLVENKKTILQDFKLNHAVLRNSLDYLPHSLKNIEAEMSTKDQVRGLYNTIVDAGLAVLAYASSEELYWADQADINIMKFRSLKNNNVEFKKQYILEHVVIVLKKSTIVKQLITAAANPVIGKTLDTLTEEYNLFYKLREQEAEKYRIGLYILPILLALYIIYVLAQLNQAKDTLEERVKMRTKELDHALINAEKANRAKSEFLSRMSHELRTPMNAILGFGQILLLDTEGLNETQHSNIKEILNAGYHLLDLINEVLDLAKIESGKLDIILEEVHVSDLLEQCIVLIGPQVEEHQLELFDHVSNKGYVVRADIIRFKQVLLNILSNAVKYNREYGHISLNSETVKKHRVRISVTNTGKGLTEDGIDKLFTPFERLNTKSNVEGTGIGLVITKHLIELMGGNIGVESIPGESCTFWIELELSRDA